MVTRHGYGADKVRQAGAARHARPNIHSDGGSTAYASPERLRQSAPDEGNRHSAIAALQT